MLLRLAAVSLLLVAAPLPGAAKPLTTDQMREDLRVAHAALIEAHPGVFRFTTRAELDRAFRDAEASLPASGDTWTVYRALAPAVALVRCGHTGIALPDSLQKELTTNRRLLPFQVMTDGGRVFVLRDFASEDQRYAGRELLRVNGRSARAVLDVLTAAQPRDGFSERAIGHRLRGWRFAGQLERLFGWDGAYTVELRAADGARETVTIEGRPLPELMRRLAARHPEEAVQPRPAALEFLDDGRIARLTVRQFGGTVDDSGKVGLDAFFRDSFAAIAARGSRALVLDLRGNGGGRDALGKQLFAHLVDRPFDYYADLVINARTHSFGRYQAKPDTMPGGFAERGADGLYHFRKHPNWGRQQPESLSFRGPVFALMDGASFSTTCEFLSHVRDAGRATLIGEETGGAYVGNTSGFDTSLPLPHSGVVLGIPLMRYDLAVKPAKPFGRGILPDVPVAVTAADRLAGKDPPLETALRLARAAR